MNRVLLQIWEMSDRASGAYRDGCSLHIGEPELKDYLDKVYGERDESQVPDEYDRVLSSPLEAYVDDELYSRLSQKGSVRISEPSLRNLLSLGDIIVKN